MRIHLQSRSGLTLIEMAVTAGLVGVLGLIIYSLLNMGTILGAKNTAMNTAHQQARVAMLGMIQDLHSAVSLPSMTNATGTPYPSPAPSGTPVAAEGIAFQQWSGGPHRIISDASPAPNNMIHIAVTLGQPTPIVGQRLIVPTHQIESDIDAISGSAGDLTVTLHDNLRVAIKGTSTASTVGDVVCYITDLCSYSVVQDSPGPPVVYKLRWTRKSDPTARDIVTDITNPKPFSIPLTPNGALYYRFVAAIDLSTSDPKYSNRGYKSANILLNGQVPYKARLTTYQ